MDMETRNELRAICDANRETTDRVTKLTVAGVTLVIELLKITTYAEYMGTYAADILLAIEPIDGKRESINGKAAKEILSHV